MPNRPSGDPEGVRYKKLEKVEKTEKEENAKSAARRGPFHILLIKEQFHEPLTLKSNCDFFAKNFFGFVIARKLFLRKRCGRRAALPWASSLLPAMATNDLFKANLKK
jgi:hypothetical protein